MWRHLLADLFHRQHALMPETKWHLNAETALPKTLPERHQQLHNALLLYCARDTLAMVRIAHYFEGAKMISGKNS